MTAYGNFNFNWILTVETSLLCLHIQLRDDTLTSMRIVQLSRSLPSLSIYVENSSTSLTLDVQFQMNPPLQMATNQLKENIIHG